jgi:hypothetical protein
VANVNAPYGFKAVRHSTGGELQTNDYPIDAGYASAIFRGDVVRGVAGGTIELSAAGDVDNIGVFAGCSYVNSIGEQKYKSYWTGEVGATNIMAHVYDDPNIIFQVQADATGIAAADLNNLADMATYAAGSVKTGLSGVSLNGTVGTTGKTFRVLRLINDSENVAGAYADAEVIFIEHALRGVVAGVGGI